MRDKEGRSRGFAFVSFQGKLRMRTPVVHAVIRRSRKDREVLEEFMRCRPHMIDQRPIEAKRAMPREEALKPEGQLTVKKIFVGGLKEDLNESDLE
jgi:hypothetical protein